MLRQTLVGSILKGSQGVSYRLVELVSESNKGLHFRAQTPQAAQGTSTFVVTVLRPEVLGEQALSAFSEEAEALRTALGLLAPSTRELSALVDHGVAFLPHEGRDAATAFVVREDLRGQSIAKIIAAHGGFGVPVGRSRRLLGHIARALFALHEVGLLHRDLNPASVLVVQDGGSERAKLVDYGLSTTLFSAPHAPMEPASVGYAPPERLGYHGGLLSPASDVFSFAAIFYEMLSGSEAFARGDVTRFVASVLTGDRPSLSRVRATLPAELREKPELVVGLDREMARALRPDPSARHASIRELWVAIEPLLREVVRPTASGQGAVVEDPVSFDGILSRPASSPEIATRTASPASVAMPASTAYSGPRSAAPSVASVASVPSWEILAPPLASDALSTGLVVEEGRAILALGTKGLYRLVRGAFSLVPLPVGVDAKSLRGIARMPSGDLLLYGHAGFCGALTARGAFRKMLTQTGLERDASWLGAYADEQAIVLVGERLSRTEGIALFWPHDGKPQFFADRSTPRLVTATRLGHGPVLVAGLSGALAQLGQEGLVELPWGRTGHLFALARGPSGQAFAVGSGGHALCVQAEPSGASAKLEGVQTTRDLLDVAMDPETGSMWASGRDARLLERRGDVWVRVPLPSDASMSLVRVFPRAGRVVVLADDGRVLALGQAS